MGQGDIQLEPRAGKGTCSTEPEKQETTPSSSSSSLTLLDVLSNPIILDAVAPILLISGVLNLAATSRAFRDLISANPSVYRYLDLSNVRAARLRPNELSSGTPAQQTESEDDFYSRPLRNIFSTLKQKNILQHVQTLVLDGLSVTAELCHDIINGSDYNVRTLSILDVSNLNHAKLRASLAYACRKTRPEGSPKLRALYVFGDITPWAARMLHGAPTNASTNPGQEAQRVWSFAHRSKPDAWWSRKGCMIAPHHATQEWAECLIACQGIIAFDAVVCQGPRHYNSPAYGVKTMPARVSNQPAVARYAVKPCHMCGECPEGLLTPAADCRGSLPLLAPPPATSASLRAATAPGPGSEAFVPRCMDCLEERYCTGCYKFWCESCYSTHGSSPDRSESPSSVNDDGSLTPPDESPFSFSAAKSKQLVTRSCWECKDNVRLLPPYLKLVWCPLTISYQCDECIDRTQKSCTKCQAGYCLIHNEGSCEDYGRRRITPEMLQEAGWVTPRQVQRMRTEFVPMKLFLARGRETL